MRTTCCNTWPNAASTLAVAFVVSERIVDALEVVDVDHHQAGGLQVAPHQVGLHRAGHHEGVSVQQAGQPVDRSEAVQLLVGEITLGENDAGVLVLTATVASSRLRAFTG